MMAGRYRKLLWLGAFIISVALSTLPIFTNESILNPIEVGAGALLMIVSLIGLTRPRRIRLPRKRVFS
jgi:hypothetical protein